MNMYVLNIAYIASLNGEDIIGKRVRGYVTGNQGITVVYVTVLYVAFVNRQVPV